MKSTEGEKVYLVIETRHSRPLYEDPDTLDISYCLDRGDDRKSRLDAKEYR